ncbi:MAG: matrixin family metalloprotease [Solirubrobacteraceae bacterium MAG38_C4-C5]|nr:matrixin family metalloprotease [Candidatus Siliceabacter maunaloa]
MGRISITAASSWRARLLAAGLAGGLTLLVAPAPQASVQSGQVACFAPGGPSSADRTNGRSPQGGPETTEVFERGYQVNRCDRDGRLIESVTARYITVPGAPSGYVPISRTVPWGDGFASDAVTYGDFVSDPVAAAAWRGAEGERLRASVTPPTLGADTSRNRKADNGEATTDEGARQGGRIRAAVVGPCDDYTYTLFGGSWTGRYYNYYTRNATFPAGDTTRVEITRGHHPWDYTQNDCGFNDITNLTSQWAGTTSTAFNVTFDNISVIDFGDMAEIGKSNSTTVGHARVWSNGSGSYVGSDQRYNKYKVWVHSGQASGYDVWNVATHETGHSIGLKGDFTGSSDTELTMFGRTDYGETKRRTLARGDILGMRALYP